MKCWISSSSFLRTGKHFFGVGRYRKISSWKELFSIIWLKAIDYNSKKRDERISFIGLNWCGKDWQGKKVAPVTRHEEGRYMEQELKPVIEKDQIVAYQRIEQLETVNSLITMIMTNGGPSRYKYDKKQQQKDAEVQKENKQYS